MKKIVWWILGITLLSYVAIRIAPELFVFFGQLLVLLPLLLPIYGVYWYMKRPRKQNMTQISTNSLPNQERSPINKTLEVVGVGFMYFFFIGMGLMNMANCRGNECDTFTTSFALGCIWLIISLLGFVYTVYMNGSSTNKWLLVFKPYIALPIFFAIIFMGQPLISGY
ncbi:MAG: hypothetical protein WCT41_01100 [Candidatus Paceibacterota bacterium]|jgi:hypothetical protein